MIRLLIADDEPLVGMGLKSMMDWRAYDVDIIGTARNGQEALEMIECHRPDIVITDIQMPKKNGLELITESQSRFGPVPVFILLTSYEEFGYARKAIQLQAVDYLVKLELDERSLSQALGKALIELSHLRGTDAQSAEPQIQNRQALSEKFFMRLLNNLFENEAEYERQRTALGLELSAPQWIAANWILQPQEHDGGDANPKAFAIFANALQLIRETLARHVHCYVVPLDLWRLSVIFQLSGEGRETPQGVVEPVALTQELLRNYMGIDSRAGIGFAVEHPLRLHDSFQSARRLCPQAMEEATLHIAEDAPQARQEDADARIQLLLRTIRKSLEDKDEKMLSSGLRELIEHLRTQSGHFLSAMDTACNVLYMVLSLLHDGELLLTEAFASRPQGYRSLYQAHSIDAVIEWLSALREGCVSALAIQRKSHKEQVIESVKRYIHDHAEKRLTLQEVAGVFNFSPNYLSQLFARQTGEGFVEYVTAVKIRAAKDMLRRGDGRIYEIAERLGFESSFYFSKVFKKTEGISPREYQQRFEGEKPV